MSVSPACTMCTMYMPGAHRGQQKTSDPLELKLELEYVLVYDHDCVFMFMEKRLWWTYVSCFKEGLVILAFLDAVTRFLQLALPLGPL